LTSPAVETGLKNLNGAEYTARFSKQGIYA